MAKKISYEAKIKSRQLTEFIKKENCDCNTDEECADEDSIDSVESEKVEKKVI